MFFDVCLFVFCLCFVYVLFMFCFVFVFVLFLFLFCLCLWFVYVLFMGCFVYGGFILKETKILFKFERYCHRLLWRENITDKWGSELIKLGFKLYIYIYMYFKMIYFQIIYFKLTSDIIIL